jgi:hypothetical protein
LNPHALRRQNLNLVRLPISPHPHNKQNTAPPKLGEPCLEFGIF